MITQLVAPKTGLTAENVQIIAWLKRQGDAVAKDEVILTIETEKATVDVEAPRSGYLAKILTPAGQSVPVAHVIALITDSPDEIL
jgi:pyruvate dehydrogenase E2 component (dihydrolipoamide acetyltransferase)